MSLGFKGLGFRFRGVTSWYQPILDPPPPVDLPNPLAEGSKYPRVLDTEKARTVRNLPKN